MKQTKYILFFIFLLVLPIVYSVPKTEPQPIGLIDIQIPQKRFIEQGLDIKLHSHVFNGTSGKSLTNESTDCFVHLYGVDGSHILQEQMRGDSNGLEFALDIYGNTTSELGEHNFIIWCNNSEAGGAVSSSVEITMDGTENIVNNPLWLILFLIIINAALFAAARIEYTESELANFLIRRCILIISMFVLALNIGVVFSLGYTQQFYSLMPILRFYLWAILTIDSIFIIVLFFNALSVANKLALQAAENKRMGNNGNRETE